VLSTSTKTYHVSGAGRREERMSTLIRDEAPTKSAPSASALISSSVDRGEAFGLNSHPRDRLHLLQALPRQTEHQASNCGCVNAIGVAPAGASRGHTKRLSFRRRAAHQTPNPSCTSSLIRVDRALANR
jgi:hypothetical protein